MAAVMDLDLSCSPPSPEPAAQDDLKRSMLRQQHTQRHQVKDLHRLYWAHKNLSDMPPFWKQSESVLRAHPPPHHSHTVNYDDTGVFSHCYGQVKQGFRRDYDEVARDSLGVKGKVRRQPDPPIAQGMRSGYRCVIDLEKPATLDDDDVEILSSQRFISYGTCRGVFPDNSQCVPPESSPMMDDLCRDHNTPYASYGSSASTDTPDSHSPVRTKTSVSGRMFFDLNVAQEDDFNICPDSSKVSCSLLASLATRNSGGRCSNSSKTFHKGSESSIGSSKGSSVTVATAISAPVSVREAMAAGLLFCDSQTNMPFCVETSEYNALVRGNMHHQQPQDKDSGLNFQGCMEIPRISSVSLDGGSNSSPDISKLRDSRAANLIGQLPVAVHREPQEDTITVISDSEVEIFDLNIAVESIDLPSKVASNYGGKSVNSYGSEENSCAHTRNEGQQSISLVECLTSRSHHMAENKASEDVHSPGSGIAINRSVSIPETPQGRDYAHPRLRSSNEVSIQLETVCIHQMKLEEDERIAVTAAETLVSIFATNSACVTGSHESTSQTDPPDGNHKPLLSLDSFEESILNLEEMKDDGESIPMRTPDKDAQSCGIKLKRGRGLRDFQREILPGLVSLARHEICDDLHAIGYGIRKTRSRRSSGEQGATPMRTRLPRRCSTAWNR